MITLKIRCSVLISRQRLQNFICFRDKQPITWNFGLIPPPQILFFRRPSSMNLSRWTSWTQSWRMTSKWRCGGRKNTKKNQFFCICCFGIAALFSLFYFIFFLLPINFFGTFCSTDKEKNDRWSDGELHNIDAGEIPGWGNLCLWSCSWERFVTRTDCTVAPQKALHRHGSEDVHLRTGEGDGLQVNIIVQ